MTSIDHVRRVLGPLPRSYEVLVHDRVKWRVGSIVFAAFSRDEATLGVAFPKEERDALVESDPAVFMLPGETDLRFNWVLARTGRLADGEATDLLLDAWAMVVPKKVSDGWFERGVAL